MNCIKCIDVLTGKEIAQGKQKCVSCLVRGYKFAMGKMFKEIEELEAQLFMPSIQKGAIAAGRGQESKKPFVLKKKLVVKKKPIKKVIKKA